MEFPYYPINDFGPVMKGLIIGAMGIVHVFLAQFAIGGGALMCYFQWLAQSERLPGARRLLDSYFKFLVLVSFVAGALTGVGMWFTTIQISPRTIGVMVDEFHWIWATEWTFFCLEIVAGYAFYRCGARLSDGRRFRLLVLYTLAAWFSLFWINGILSWQLTPDGWLGGAPASRVWAGFFNPTFWPSLIFRTICCLTIAALAACAVINTMHDLDRSQRQALVGRAARLLAPMTLMPAIGVWFLQAMPPDSRSWVLGGSAAMTLFMALAAGASLLIGLYALVALLRNKLYINGATATLLLALAFGATAGGEFVREGVRKPYTIRETLYSNSIARTEVDRLRETGCIAADPYPLRDAARYPAGAVRLGAQVFRLQCSVCHTVDAANGLTHLTGSWTVDQKRLNIAKLQHTKPFMPPFAGTARECEALVQFLEWSVSGRPATWSGEPDTTTLAQVQRYLDEAGTAPGIMRQLAGSAQPDSPRQESSAPEPTP